MDYYRPCWTASEDKIWKLLYCTLMDYFSKWPEAAALPDKRAESVALFLYRMICRYVHVYYDGMKSI